jgi:hypothetical protein
MPEKYSFGENQLPFPTRKVAIEGGTVEVYIIPDDKKEAGRFLRSIRSWKTSMPRRNIKSKSSW